LHGSDVENIETVQNDAVALEDASKSANEVGGERYRDGKVREKQ
jgi:hypothetical protein